MALVEPSVPLFHIVLVEPEIPQNTGTVGRLCLGTGCRLHLVQPLGFRVDAKAVRRAGLDYWKNVDLQIHPDFPTLQAALHGHRFIMTSARTGRSFTEHRFLPGDVLVFGKESVGLPDTIRNAYPDAFIRIPTRDTIRSLNLSQAVAVVVYEGLKQIHPSFFR